MNLALGPLRRVHDHADSFQLFMKSRDILSGIKAKVRSSRQE
jgi:hypothetical protein